MFASEAPPEDEFFTVSHSHVQETSGSRSSAVCSHKPSPALSFVLRSKELTGELTFIYTCMFVIMEEAAEHEGNPVKNMQTLTERHKLGLKLRTFRLQLRHRELLKREITRSQL